jgi:hypothetical protein
MGGGGGGGGGGVARWFREDGATMRMGPLCPPSYVVKKSLDCIRVRNLKHACTCMQMVRINY